MPSTISDIQVTEDYAIHYTTLENFCGFQIYPIQHWGKESKTGFYYQSKQEDIFVNEFDVEVCLIRMSGSCKWNGLWIEKIYLKGDYWGSDLRSMADIYENTVLPGCKERIKNFSKSLLALNAKTE